MSREEPESNTTSSQLLWPRQTGAQVRGEFRYLQNLLCHGSEEAFTVGWNTSSQREQDPIRLVFSFYCTGFAIMCAILIVSQGSNKISKCLEKKGVFVSAKMSWLFHSRFANNSAGPALHVWELHKKKKWSCNGQPSAIRASGDKEQHLNSLLFLSHPWEKCGCCWI